jgi:hypothetical protein
MTPDLAKLKEIAKAATPGPWVERPNYGDPEGTLAIIKIDPDGGIYWIVSRMAAFKDIQNATFIATFNPTTVLSLIERLELAEGALKNIQEKATVAAYSKQASAAHVHIEYVWGLEAAAKIAREAIKETP